MGNLPSDRTPIGVGITVSTFLQTLFPREDEEEDDEDEATETCFLVELEDFPCELLERSTRASMVSKVTVDLGLFLREVSGRGSAALGAGSADFAGESELVGVVLRTKAPKAASFCMFFLFPSSVESGRH